MASIATDDQDAAATERGRSVGLWIREGQARLDINNKVAAKRCGVSETYFGILSREGRDTKTGKIIRPSPEKLKLIADGLGIDCARGMSAAGWGEEEITRVCGGRVSSSANTRVTKSPQWHHPSLPETITVASGRKLEIVLREGEPGSVLKVTPRTLAILDALAKGQADGTDDFTP